MTTLTEMFAGALLEGTFGKAVENLMQRRLRAARQILVEELRRGNKSLSDVAGEEEAAAAVYRYARAAQEGAARLNLRLLAKVIAGHQKPERPLYASEFLRYADILASLSREEIVLLATLYRCEQQRKGRGEMEEQEDDRPAAVRKAALAELVPTVLPTEDEYTAVASALMRTGLITPLTAWDGMLFQTTPAMARLQRLASLEGALAEEGAS